MAKKRSSRPSRRDQRDTRSYPSQTRLDPYNAMDWPSARRGPIRFPSLRTLPPYPTWAETSQDARYFTPHAPTRSRMVTGGNSYVHPVVPHRPTPKRLHDAPVWVGFEVPRETTVCVRRKQRREVIFATNRAGRGGSRRRRRTVDSNVRC